ncbi:MAG: lasso RiPP family leader peptide-containing protein [Trueperaceae bacterium]|nr:lasso RiPP family leader peptide-containing protein [Trueperaceae bacterium]
MTDTKRPYQTPKLVAWGTVVDLTQVAVDCVVDSAFSGSVPCYPGDPPT